MNHDITHLSFCIDEDDDEVIINENKLKASAVSYVIRRIRAGVSEPEDNGGELTVLDSGTRCGQGSGLASSNGQVQGVAESL
ncbi:hypothetical protein IscW_ISCW012117 [Ixodes scapularis]|uniref:Uncharacterized protein n=1 Tax=Ixodes scapularis TaxID=6945 RepID=B7QGC9_IXOSC|nr:hypothetical protein IscW_ISCW012117 [Ixodes scapularis]|eukprot:XP_002401500.1 hypothetical protein IscW_ISCW012117 [Ixodes scapularis]